MNFTSRDNKGLLWQLLSDHPLQKKDPTQFQKILEHRVSEINKNRFTFNSNLLLMNKEVLKQFAKEIPNEISNKTSKPLNKQGFTKRQIFETRLKEQQNEFTSLINKPKVKEIDFSDKTEEEPITNRMVDSQLEQREAELKKIMAQYDKSSTEEWLKGESTSTDKKLAIDQSSNIKIEPTIIKTPEVKTPEAKTPKVKTPEVKTPEVKTPKVKTPKAKKRVTFDVTESDSFLSGLKTKIKGESEINYKSEINGDNLTLILKELSTIKENQLKILGFMKRKDN